MTDIAKLYEELRSIIDGGSESYTHEDAVAHLKQVMAQPEQEPFTYYDPAMDSIRPFRSEGDIPLYTTPPQRTWVGLSEGQKRQLNESLNLQGRFPIIDAIEAVCKGNNT